MQHFCRYFWSKFSVEISFIDVFDAINVIKNKQNDVNNVKSAH